MKYYHSTEEGCELTPMAKSVGYDRFVYGQYCLTHKVFVCKCGSEFGHHFDVYENLAKNNQ
jgi:hypothetical protein